MTPHEQLINYVERGFKIVPVPAGKKGPVIPDWKNLRIKNEEDIRKHFNGGGGNVGLILGDASGGLIDIDLDCPEAREAALRHLPPTDAKTGRPSAPDSHWWYRCGEVDKIRQFRDPETGDMILEIRTNGGQTLVGPSIHPSGEPYAPLINDPAAVRHEDLIAAVERVYADVLLARNRPIATPKKPEIPQVKRDNRPLDDQQAVIKRARAYLAAMPPSISGAGGHNATFEAACRLVHGFSLDAGTALALLVADYNPRCQPPWTEKELDHKVCDAMLADHALPRGHLLNAPPPAPYRAAIAPPPAPEALPEKDVLTSLASIIARCPKLRPPVIDGLLREGETLNVIAPPKTGKSWLVLGLAFALANGHPWLGMDTVQGDVLILDNELHDETLSDRAQRVASVKGLCMDWVAQHIFCETMRGRLQDILSLESFFKKIARGSIKICILDALYRFIPPGVSENDNAAMAHLYNRIDYYADMLGCAFILIHHSSKGNQSEKNVMDVGAGAGSIGRATDSHLILRRLEEDSSVAMESETRSWPPRPPVALRWDWPLWSVAPELDPKKLKRAPTNTPKHTVDDLMESWFDGIQCSAWAAAALESGISERSFYRLKKQAVDSGRVVLIGKEYRLPPPK